MMQFHLKLLLTQRILAMYHDFHLLPVATKLLTAKIHSRDVVSGVPNRGDIYNSQRNREINIFQYSI